MEDEEIIRNIDFEDDDSIAYAIKKVKESDMYTGVNDYQEIVVIAIQKNNGIRVSTYQNNGWIRINDYDLRLDEYANEEIIRSESYEKS